MKDTIDIEFIGKYLNIRTFNPDKYQERLSITQIGPVEIQRYQDDSIYGISIEIPENFKDIIIKTQRKMK